MNYANVEQCFVFFSNGSYFGARTRKRSTTKCFSQSTSTASVLKEPQTKPEAGQRSLSPGLRARSKETGLVSHQQLGQAEETQPSTLRALEQRQIKKPGRPRDSVLPCQPSDQISKVTNASGRPALAP